MTAADKKVIGVVDCNPLHNPTRGFIMDRIRSLVPRACAIEDFHYTDDLDFSTCDALVLSGSELFATDYQSMLENDSLEGDDYIHIDRLAKALDQYKGPIFGICFGAQLLAHVCAGKLGKMPAVEVGYLDHALTSEGREDQIFGMLPANFYGAHHHFDIVEELPDPNLVRVAEVLATRDGRIHAFKIITNDGRLRYGTQPHPEVSDAENALFFAKRDVAVLRKEFGNSTYEELLNVPPDVNYEFGNIVTRFIEMEVLSLQKAH